MLDALEDDVPDDTSGYATRSSRYASLVSLASLAALASLAFKVAIGLAIGCAFVAMRWAIGMN